jgi:NADH dehydrogenase FAD-containing subunit
LSLNEEEREAYQNLVIVGAGATGVELAVHLQKSKRMFYPKIILKLIFQTLKFIWLKGAKTP